MVVLGIDPGTLKLGWGIVDQQGNRMTHVAHGVIRMSGKLELASRLCEIEAGIAEVLRVHEPAVASVESLFFHKDAQAAAKLGHARGVVLLTLARAGLPVFEYAPARVKRAIAGNGRADKRQVAFMVRAMLCLPNNPPEDAADALGLAVTHLRFAPMVRLQQRFKEAKARG